MKKKTEKHPKDMTTDEAVQHLFHSKVVEHVKKHARNPTKPLRGAKLPRKGGNM